MWNVVVSLSADLHTFPGAVTPKELKCQCLCEQLRLHPRKVHFLQIDSLSKQQALFTQMVAIFSLHSYQGIDIKAFSLQFPSAIVN